MIIKNVKIYTPDKTFADGSILIRDGVFAEIKTDPVTDFDSKEPSEEMVIDGNSCYAIPGLIDMHLHGCMGHDFCDGTKEAIEGIAAYEASVGVTAIAPATMTLPVEKLEQVLRTAADYKRETAVPYHNTGVAAETAKKADLVGINMEGPFINLIKKGAQDARSILPCNVRIAQRFLNASEGLVKIIGLAPEEGDRSVEYIRQMKEQVHISLAHTNASYEMAKAAFEAGADHVVHLYNAMSPFTHREPGVVGAVADCPYVTAELICDGIHVHPAVVRATLQMIGTERVIFISDSMRAAGMPDGRYTLGGLDVDVHEKRAVLVSDGALAGSATNLMDCMRIAVKEMGIPLETAVACVTMNPAKKLGIYGEYGSMEPGKKANMVLLDGELRLKMVIKDGMRIR